jgi:hypothetical protein
MATAGAVTGLSVRAVEVITVAAVPWPIAAIMPAAAVVVAEFTLQRLA